MNSILLLLALFALPAHVEGTSCPTVRLADIGWTDVSVTTAVAQEILQALGYDVKVSLTSLPVTFAGLENGDIDVFLGNWMPTQEADIRPFLERGSLIQMHKNLTGARYSLAVPDYVYQAGIRSVMDLASFAEQFSRTIYALEPGNDGNRLINAMIDDHGFGLKGWQLVESSEQGMLTEVKEAIKEGNWIVFLGWSPHPMNLSFKMRFLSGAEHYFGPNFGASSVHTVMNKQFSEACPQVTALFRHMTFSIEMENALMQEVLENDVPLKQAARAWLGDHQNVVIEWLKEIPDAKRLHAVQSLKKNSSDGHEKSSFAIPLGRWLEGAINFLTDNFSHQFRAAAHKIEQLIDTCTDFVLKIKWIIIVSIFSLLVLLTHRSFKLFLSIFIGLLIIVNLSLWTETIQTLILITLSVLVSVTIGIPLGIVAAHRPLFYKIMRPLLDLMQTLPTFVYLIPTLVLFGLGVVPGLVATVLFSIAAPIRCTYFGISQLPSELIEAADAFGASRWQRLVKVELPGAMPSIMMGCSQCIMLSLSMVVIAALVGAEGLGEPVVRALNTVDIKLGCEAGIAIVILALMLDRCCSTKS